MNRLPETVSQQFNQLFAVIGQASDDLKLTIAEASMAGNFSLVTANIENCQRLQALELEIKTCMGNFVNKPQAQPMEKAFHKRNKHRTRQPRGSMRVTLAGRIIEKPTIAETFFEALKAFGLDRVASLNKVVTAIPLVSRRPATGYQTQKTCNGWHVTTHVNAYTAPTVLREIADELKMAIQIEFIER
ncbi:hypothetical protein QZJ86_06600 [Methylomonas montana]|uniref:hypothetical protein n=1 Tax=Methylomonas montana TaxID=3058963 RepID=UPI002658480C|nr:hypothetical protein [Methylomonas montana]WKJ91803.1 hypothetical protein QZJ86_06600 [Methylomonas montana]